MQVDVLCVGAATWDLTFEVEAQPGEDEKVFARSLTACGGGPAANAAITASKMGCSVAFSGCLGQDAFGNAHIRELEDAKVNTDLVLRTNEHTALSTVLVKPDGKRSLINYRSQGTRLQASHLSLDKVQPKVILFDGHEPAASIALAQAANEKGIHTVLDAGSIHVGTETLAPIVSHLLASEKFGLTWTQENDPTKALESFQTKASVSAVTIGKKGLYWKSGDSNILHLQAFPVNAVDTTGAGDIFHGAYAAALAQGKDITECLRFASAAAALGCTKLGARTAIPDLESALRLLG